MSLVQQAIARLRQGAPEVSTGPAAPPAPAATGSAADSHRAAPRATGSGADSYRAGPRATAGDADSYPAAARATASDADSYPVAAREPLVVDLGALRARGYLPEEAVDRQLADNYRQIKRPIIEKAAAVTDPAKRDPRIIMVTSALPGDGKTFTSLNLALSIARERDFSLLLIDADTPKPHVSDIFDLVNEPGLGDALLDERVQIESLIVPTTVRGFSILPAGRSCPGAAELLVSNRMQALLAALLKNNPRRLVLLDSAPMLITSEGKALLKVAGQKILVVRAGQTPRSAVREALALMGDHHGVGIVLNEGEASFTEGYYGYGNYGNRTD